MQTLMHQKTRMWRSLKVVLISPTPTKARRRIKITLEDPLLQEDMMQATNNIIKESQGIITLEISQGNPHSSC